jgi:4-amino-4-deoxy-L-arabinose transferase-like glycosyltransferase
VGLTICAAAGIIAWRVTAAVAGRRIQEADALLVLTALLGFIGLVVIEPLYSTAGDWQWNAPPSIRFGMIGAGIASAGLATVLLVENSQIAWVMPLWVIALACVAAGLALHMTGGITSRQVELASLIALIGVAVYLRIPNLASVPVVVHGDEASIGIQARHILNGQEPALVGLGWANLPELGYAIYAASLAVFGDNLFGLRMGSVLEGVLSIILLYLLVRRLWVGRPAIFAAAFMAAAAWHIQYSRTGFHYMQGPLFFLLAAYLLVRALQTRRLLDFVLCGFAVAATLEVYSTARLAPLVLLMYVCFRSLTERDFLRTHVRGLAALVVAFSVFVAPLVVVWSRSAEGMAARSSEFIFNAPSYQHELSSLHVDSMWSVIAAQTVRTLEAFNIRGGTGLQYAHPWPLLDPWTGALLAIGALPFLVRLRSSNDVLLAAWVWLGLIVGSVLTVDALFTPHGLVVLPALTIVAALALDYMWSASASVGALGRAAATLAVTAIIVAAFYANADDYFRVSYAFNQPNTMSLLVRYANASNDRYRLVVFPSDGFNLTSEIPQFLVRNPDAMEVRNAQLQLPLADVPTRKGVAFLVQGSVADAAQLLTPIEAIYPQGETDVITRPDGKPGFVSYRVDHAALTEADPHATLN